MYRQPPCWRIGRPKTRRGKRERRPVAPPAYPDYELFGIWGAIFVAPVVGLCQAIIVFAWAEWRAAHHDQFPRTPPTAPEPHREPEPTAPSRSG